MSVSPTLPPSYFDAVYAANADPWGFETSAYEARKYAATLEALPQARYANAFEAGCSIGVLTHRLAERCDQLLSVDVSEAALDQARDRCQDQPHVTFERRVLPDEFPVAAALFDLVLVSEVGYYFSEADLGRFRAHCAEALAPGGTLLLVHWTAPVHDYPMTGDDVHGAFLADPAFEHVHGARAPEYRLDCLLRASGALTAA